MNIETKTFKEEVLSTAKELRVTPKLLLIAIAAIAENPIVNDIVILHHYGKHLLDDMVESARHQIKSKNKNSREAGEHALAQSNQVINESDGLISLKGIVKDGQQITNLHVYLMEHVDKEAKEIIKRFSRKTNQQSLSGIIKTLCPGLVERCRSLAIIMRDDFNFN